MTTTTVEHVSLFRIEPVKTFFVNKDNDYQVPLLALGCLSLLANQAKNFAGYDLGHIIDFGKIGGQLSDLPDYWEFGSSLRYLRQSVIEWISPSGGEDAGESSLGELAKRVGMCALSVLHAVSSGGVFLSTMCGVGALEGISVQKIKFGGSLCGSLYFLSAVYGVLKGLSESPDDIDTLKNQEAKDIYQAQDQSRKWLKVIGATSILFLKIVTLNAATSGLLGSAYALPALIEWEGVLQLTFFTTWTLSYIGAHFFGEQMQEFKNKNQM